MLSKRLRRDPLGQPERVKRLSHGLDIVTPDCLQRRESLYASQSRGSDTVCTRSTGNVNGLHGRIVYTDWLHAWILLRSELEKRKNSEQGEISILQYFSRPFWPGRGVCLFSIFLCRRFARVTPRMLACTVRYLGSRVRKKMSETPCLRFDGTTRTQRPVLLLLVSNSKGRKSKRPLPPFFFATKKVHV